MVGQRKGSSGANAPPVHGIKKCLVSTFGVEGVIGWFIYIMNDIIMNDMLKTNLNKEWLSETYLRGVG